ncbi:MAG: polyprenyl synthetase family protein [Proteobacteria bacterium]|jgi:octaprenyl-diphosphate synthase|nr:polyprenyl synthetase family protein [Alphaproteobacteria bacterium]NCC02576.1 polyprenyl synthetase family protein [Pseudomonadota bacterium]
MVHIIPLRSEQAEPPANALDVLQDLAAKDMAAVNHIILQRMQSNVPLIPHLAHHIIASGGKRLRPLLAVTCTRLCGYQGDRHHKLAAAVEFIHTATLLHDDVVDASDLRRGSPSANAMFGNEPSILVGDFLFSRSFQLMVEDGSIDVLRILSNASAVISEGEVLQLTAQNDSTISEQTYLDIIKAKTAELFAASCRIGAVIAARPSGEEEALRTYGLNLGIAFQIVDDVLDYSAQQARLGKTVGDDFREGKITLPVILAIRRGNEAERAFWQRTLGEQKQRDGDFAHALDILNRHGSLRDCIARARHYGAIARDALGLFPEGPIKTALIDTIDFTIDRAY